MGFCHQQTLKDSNNGSRKVSKKLAAIQCNRFIVVRSFFRWKIGHFYMGNECEITDLQRAGKDRPSAGHHQAMLGKYGTALLLRSKTPQDAACQEN